MGLKLIENADIVLKRAWSVRLIVISAGLSGLEVTLSVVTAFQVKTGVPPGLFALLAGLVTVAAGIARFIAQPGAQRAAPPADASVTAVTVSENPPPKERSKFMAMVTNKRVVGGASAVALLGAGLYGAIINQNVKFTPTWEGMDAVVRIDKIGTGHPPTWCYGQTPAHGMNPKLGTRFTKKECDAQIAKSLPKYLDAIVPCAVGGKIAPKDVPVKSWSALVDGGFNGGSRAVCKSPMMARLRAGDLRGMCDAFNGWYVRSDGVVRPGLIARRSGRPGDARKSERALCLEGLKEGAFK